MFLEKFIGKNSVKNDLSQSIGSRWILYITNFRWHYIFVDITNILEEGLRNLSSSNNRNSFRLLNHVYLINMFNIHDERDRYILTLVHQKSSKPHTILVWQWRNCNSRKFMQIAKYMVLSECSASRGTFLKLFLVPLCIKILSVL